MEISAEIEEEEGKRVIKGKTVSEKPLNSGKKKNKGRTNDGASSKEKSLGMAI